MDDHGDMPLEDFTHGLYKNVNSIKHAMWVLVLLEAAKFIAW